MKFIYLFRGIETERVSSRGRLVKQIETAIVLIGRCSAKIKPARRRLFIELEAAERGH